MKIAEKVISWAKGQKAEIEEAVQKYKQNKSKKEQNIKSRIEDIQHRYEKESENVKKEAQEAVENVKTEAEKANQEFKEKAQEKKEKASQDEQVKSAVEKARETKDKVSVKTEEVLDSFTEDANTKNNLSSFEAINTSGNRIVIEAENEAKVAQMAIDKGHARKQSSLTINKLED